MTDGMGGRKTDLSARLPASQTVSPDEFQAPMSSRKSRSAPPPFVTMLALLPLALAACQPAARSPAQAEPDPVARGEYLVRIGGCNDCHTPGYGESGGQVDKAYWLTGSPLGYHGPWGTTYPTNLRLSLQKMTEAQWMDYSANLRARPPMPDFTVRAMTEDDRRAIYRFVRSLGDAGQPAPEALPPGQTPPPPVFTLLLPAVPAAAKPDAND